MSLTRTPRSGVTPRAAQPAPPSRLYSFTGWQASNPTAPPPGDRMDADYDNTNTALTQTLSWAAVSLNTDGTLKAGSVGQSQMVSGLFDDIAQDIIAEVQPLVDQASGSAASAWAASTAAQASATAADRSNTAAGSAASMATTAANTATTAQSAAQGYATTAQTASSSATTANNHAQGAAALAQDYADVTQAWAEHMPDTIPPNILAVMGITGDHWSSRWWANQAAVITTGAINYRGAWNPVTNTPILASGGLATGVASKKGDYYLVSVTGMSVPIDGQTTWVGGDLAVSSGTAWQRVQLVYTAAPPAKYVANVLDFGADPAGVADSTAAFIAALASGKNAYVPKGSYLIRNQLTLNNGQELFGDGRGMTTLLVDQTFSPTATGVISLTGREQLSPCVRDLAIQFAQPSDQSSRSNFKTLAAGGTSVLGGTGVMYPPAIAITSTNRFRLYRLRISRAWDGIINAAGNTIGGFFIRDIEMSAFNCGLGIDNAFDFGHIAGYHFWSFDIQSSLVNVFGDGGTFGAKFGVTAEVDGISVVDFTCFWGRVQIINSRCWMHFSNLMMDGDNATLEVLNGAWIQISNLYFTGDSSGLNTNAGQLNVSGGNVFINNLRSASGGKPQISITGGTTVITGGTITTANPAVGGIVVSGGRLNINGVSFGANTGAGAWTAPVVSVTGTTSAISFKNNIFNNPSPGDVGALVITNDHVGHEVSGNLWNGWKFTPPGVQGAYGFNDTTSYRSVRLEALPGHEADLFLVAAAGTQRSVAFMTGTGATISTRWEVYANAGGESGGNAGSDFLIARFDDTGALLDAPISITRSTGNVTMLRNLGVGGVATVASLFVTGQSGFNGRTPVGQPVVTGSRGGNAALASLLAGLANYGLINDTTTA